MVAAHAHDIEAGQKHQLQEQHFVNGQGLDLHLKALKMILPKIKFVLLTMSDIGKDCQTIF